METASTLLVVDDDLVTRMMLTLTLKQHGYEVQEAESGSKCLEIVMNTTVDIVLLDAMLPDINGFQCCSMLHEHLQERCPPILMVTGLEDETSVNRAFEVNAIDYVTKPINFAVLRHRIQRVLRERQLMQDLEAVNRRLTQMAQTDSLTQLANRGFFEQALKEAWQQSTQKKQPIGILLCDLDYFKQYNDTYGHLEGDRCLKEIAVILQTAVLHPNDLVARYGGEEFVILLPDTDEPGIEVVAARIRYCLAERALPHRGSKVSEIVTCSLGGVLTTPRPGTNPEVLIAAADKALYEAKANGRDRLVLRSLRI